MSDRRAKFVVAGILGMALLLACLPGCEQAIVVNATNPPATRPDPLAPPAPASRPVMLGSIHPPYEKEGCDGCHVEKQDMSNVVFDVSKCLKCHDKLMSEHHAMHGPVVTGACLKCHVAHESPAPALLARGDQTLCTQCHPLKTLSLRATAHRSKRRNCLECHLGHGGADWAMLKPDAAPWRKGPATRASAK